MIEIKKVAVYIRVSTEMQDTHGSLEIQELKMREYCENKGFQIYKMYSDVMSGASSKRKSFIELEKCLSLNLFDAVVVWSSDRLSRDLLQRLIFFNEMNKHRIHFISATEPQLSTTTPEGRLMLNITGTIAEHERELISKRTSSNKRKRAEENKYLGGGISYGYKVVDTKFVIDEDKAPLMRSIFRDMIKKRNAKEVSREYKVPYHSLLERLRNPIYAGGLRYARRVKNLHTGVRRFNANYQITWGIIPEIVSKEEWDLVQEIITTNKQKFVAKYSKISYLYSGLLFCECGGKMHGNKMKASYYYKCEFCSKRINKIYLEPLVKDELFKSDKLVALNDSNFSSFEYYSEIDNAIKNIENISKKKDSTVDLYIEGLISKDKLKENIRDFDKLILKEQKDIEILNQKIEKLKNLDTKIDNLEALKFILENNTEDTISELKEILHLIINKIEVINIKPLKINIII